MEYTGLTPLDDMGKGRDPPHTGRAGTGKSMEM